MADWGGNGTLFQIFTGAVGDRPTFFFEVSAQTIFSAHLLLRGQVSLSAVPNKSLVLKRVSCYAEGSGVASETP